MHTPDVEEMPLPHGWIEEVNETGHPYYVDTLADPPRSIWIHPYEDEQYLQHHPEDRGKLEAWFGPNSRSPSPSGHYPTPAMPMTDEHSIGGDRALMAERELIDERRSGRELGGGPLGGLFGERSFGDRGLGDRGFGGGGLLGGLSRRDERFDRRMMRRQERFDRHMERRMERRGLGRFAPPVYVRPDYYPGQYGYGPQYGPQYAQPQYAPQYAQQYTPPPQSRPPPPKKEESHTGKVLPFLGGMAAGVVMDELYHHHKDKKEEEKEKHSG